LTAFLAKTQAVDRLVFHMCLFHRISSAGFSNFLPLLKSLSPEAAFPKNTILNKNQHRCALVRKRRIWFGPETDPLFLGDSVYMIDKKAKKLLKWSFKDSDSSSHGEDYPLPFEPKNEDQVLLVNMENELNLTWLSKERAVFYSFDSGLGQFDKPKAEIPSPACFDSLEESHFLVASDGHGFAILEIVVKTKDMVIWWFDPKKTSAKITRALTISHNGSNFTKGNRSSKTQPYSVVLNSQNSRVVVYKATTKWSRFIIVDLEKQKICEECSVSIDFPSKPVRWFNLGEETI
jgi:hypothetical protein